MKTVYVIFGFMFCLVLLNAADVEKAKEKENGLYTALDKKIKEFGMKKENMPESSKKEILNFWALYKKYHMTTKVTKLPVKEIKLMGRAFKIELKEKKPIINIEGHIIPLIIKDNYYIFTTGDVVFKEGSDSDYTLEIIIMLKDKEGYKISKKNLSEITKLLKQ